MPHRCACDHPMRGDTPIPHNQLCSICYWRDKYSRFEEYDMDALIEKFKIEKRNKYHEGHKKDAH